MAEEGGRRGRRRRRRGGARRSALTTTEATTTTAASGGSGAGAGPTTPPRASASPTAPSSRPRWSRGRRRRCWRSTGEMKEREEGNKKCFLPMYTKQKKEREKNAFLFSLLQCFPLSVALYLSLFLPTPRQRPRRCRSLPGIGGGLRLLRRPLAGSCVVCRCRPQGFRLPPLLPPPPAADLAPPYVPLPGSIMLALSARLSALTSPSRPSTARSRPPAFSAPLASLAPARAAAATSAAVGPCTRALGRAARSRRAGTVAPDTRGTTARLSTGPNEATAAGAEAAAEAASASASADARAPGRSGPGPARPARPRRRRARGP